MQEYKQFLSSSESRALPELPFIKVTYPKQDILVAVSRTDEPRECMNSIETLGETLGLKPTRITPAATVLSELEPLRQDGRYALFSGMGRTDTRLIVGMKDIDSPATADALSGQLGTFALIRSDEQSMTVETDYLGTGKLYYYCDETVCLISSRIHLIVLAMKQLHITRRPNARRIYAGLSSFIMTRQNFSQEMNVEGLVALRADSRLRIDLSSGQIQVERTSLYALLSQPVPYTEEAYREVLKQAAAEIVDNLRIALEHSAFDKFVMHVTGGMDTRAVLCALAHFPQYQHKVVGKTVKTRLEGDFSVALKLLSKLGLSYGRIPLKQGVPYRPNWNFEVLSTQLGATPETGKSLDSECRLPGDRVCILPGFFGDSLSRLCFTEKSFDGVLNDSTVSDFVYAQLLSKSFTHKYTIFNAAQELQDTLVRECMALPGINNLAKYENHYLFYRNGLHFNTAYDYQPFAPFWGILQSTALLKLKIMTFSQGFGSRLELDLLYELDPGLASVEFEKQGYNDLRSELDERYHRYPVCAKFDQAAIERLERDWEENERYMSAQLKIGAGTPPEIDLEGEDMLMAVLYNLVTALNLREDAGSSLYYYLKYQKSHPEYNYVVRKLYSLYYELY